MENKKHFENVTENSTEISILAIGYVRIFLKKMKPVYILNLVGSASWPQMKSWFDSTDNSISSMSHSLLSWFTAAEFDYNWIL